MKRTQKGYVMFGLGKNTDAIDALAGEVVAAFEKRFPPARQAELGGSKLDTARQLARAVHDLENSVAKFALDNKLGVYGKARVLNQIKWKLKELDYSPDFIDATTTNLTKIVASSK